MRVHWRVGTRLGSFRLISAFIITLLCWAGGQNCADRLQRCSLVDTAV